MCTNQQDGVNCVVGSSIFIQPCYCMSYDPTTNSTHVADCYLDCSRYLDTIVQVNSSTEFNNQMCGRFKDLHRTGNLCAECEDNHGLAAYSYQMFECAPCEHYGYKNWLQYFAITLLPLTVFYIAALIFDFNVTSSRFNTIVLVIQVLMSPVLVEFILPKHVLHTYQAASTAMNIAIGVGAILNLDFFRMLYKPFCLNRSLNVIEILCLNYFVALYPFLLIFLTYVLVTLYDREYRLLIWMWRPFKMCSTKWFRDWNIRSSLIGLFATFLLLSYVKILSVSTEILFLSLGRSEVKSYDKNGDITSFYYATIYDANIPYLGTKHLPFVLLALVISFSFVLLPFLLLLIYPCGCFHRLCLNRCGGRCRTLHVFMDVFLGSYRTQPRDMRYFAAFYLFLRAVLLCQWHIFLSNGMLYTSGIISFAAAAIVALCQPYKIRHHNAVDSVLMILLGVYYISFYGNTFHYILIHYYTPMAMIMSISEGLSLGLLIFYFLLLLMWKLFYSKLKLLCNKCKLNRGDQTNAGSIESFRRDYGSSDRHTHSPLLPPAESSTY